MFSDPSKRQHRFRLTAAVTIGALLLAAIGLTVANTVQGPHLLDAQINPGSAVESAGERLVLRIDQTVATVTTDQVSVTPIVPVEPRSDGADLILRFGDTLSYATSYEIVAKVRSATTGASSTLRYSFRTPDGVFYVLQRAALGADAGAPDQIVRHFIGSTEPVIVHSQPFIEEYAVADPAIAVVTSDAAGAGTLTVGPVDGSEPPRTLADNSVISQLKSSGPGGVLGFVLTPLRGPELTRRGGLRLYDPVAGGKLIKVSGFDGKPLDPMDWAFVPGTTAIVAQLADGSFYLVDPLNGTPAQPLGSHSRMYGFVPGSTSLIVDDNGDYKAIDLATGNTSTLPAIAIPGAAVHELLPLGGDRGYIGLLATQAGGSLRYSIAVISDGNVRQIYTEHPASSIESICPSPNGQYLAVAKVPNDTAANPDSSGLPNTTEVVDTASGWTDQDVAGSNVNWCN